MLQKDSGRNASWVCYLYLPKISNSSPHLVLKLLPRHRVLGLFCTWSSHYHPCYALKFLQQHWLLGEMLPAQFEAHYQILPHCIMYLLFIQFWDEVRMVSMTELKMIYKYVYWRIDDSSNRNINFKQHNAMNIN